MAYTGVKASADPAVGVDTVTLNGVVSQVQLNKLIVATENGIAPIPADANLGLYVVANSVTGPLAVDSAITTQNPVILGGRAFDLAPTRVSAEGDLQMLWLGVDGAMNTYSRIDGAQIGVTTVQPNPGAYVAGDVVGNVLQFNGVALANQRGCTINGIFCEDTTGTTAADINLALFAASPTSPPADSAAFSGLSHATRIAAGPLGIVQFPAGNFVNGLCDGQINGGPFTKNAYPAGTTIYGIAYIGATLGGKATAGTGAFWFGMDVTYN